MKKQVLPLGSFAANCVVLWNPDEPHDGDAPCWIVDPGADADDLIAFLAERKLSPALIALTHAHFDHSSAIPGLLAKWPELAVHMGAEDAPFLGHPQNAWPPDYPANPKPQTLVADLEDGMTLSAGGISAKVLAMPGHTPGGVAFWFEAEKLVITGDTLFAGSAGRTDFPGGDPRKLSASLGRLAALPPETSVICGHGPATTIARERASNPFMPN